MRNASAMTDVLPLQKTKEQRRPRLLPPFLVVLHNDDVNTFDEVIGAIVCITHLTPKQAAIRAVEAHDHGSAVLLATHRERAELYVEQFTSALVTVTCEPDCL
jgi:ATP-dependent Clp protease adaptor protein ClpS